MTRNLSEFLPKSYLNIHGVPDVAVSGFSSDSRQTAPGHIFFAVKGEQSDGNRFINPAIKNGAVAIVSELDYPGGIDTVYIQVQDIYVFMAEISALFYSTENPALTIIGVTGTNGKTTTAFFINEMLKSFGRKTVFIGTIGIEICGEKYHTDYTTPPSFELHRIMRSGLKDGAAYLVMEVSSHALKFRRVWGLQFDAAVFTNLTHEHREIHPTMEDYFVTKRQLFFMLKKDGVGLINADDAYGKRILEQQPELTDYGYSAKHIRIMNCRATDSYSQRIQYESYGHAYQFNFPMIGEYNAYNAVAAAEILAHLGYERKRIHETLPLLGPVPGRLERIEIENKHVLIDFAHTPDGLEKLLRTVADIRTGSSRIVTVFGCPGSRDPSKRPMMGRIASELSDHVIVTTDDIHHEKPDAIIQDITSGISKKNFETIPDRREAIAKGLREVQDGDYLVIAGRGHEKFQYVGDEKVPFLDREVLIEEAGKAELRIKK